MLATLLEARESALRNIAGACPNTHQFRALVNEATQQLMRRGDWPGLIQPIHVCVKRGCVVFPRYVKAVRKINLCHHSMPIKNFNADFLDHQDRNDCWGGWMGQEQRGTYQGQTPVYQDIMGEGRFVRAYIQVQADIGKTATIFGVDNNGQTLRHQNSDGSWSEGVILTFAMLFTSTPSYVRRIDRVLKDPTQSDVRLYGYDDANDVLEDITLMEPSETNPSLARYQLDFCSSGGCGTSKSIIALIKLAFIPVRADTDLVLIENLQALKTMMQSIKYREAGDFANARESEAYAFSELNYSTEDELTNDQIPVNIQPAAFFMGQRSR